MVCSGVAAMKPAILMSYQSTVAVKPGRKVGVSTTPSVRESETSGFRNGLPPMAPSHWLVGQLSAAENTEPAGTPVAMQSAAVVGVLLPAAEQGSRPGFA